MVPAVPLFSIHH